MSRNAREQQLEGRVNVSIPHTAGDSFLTKWKASFVAANVGIAKPEKTHQGPRRVLSFKLPEAATNNEPNTTPFFIQKIVERYANATSEETAGVFVTFKFDDYSSAIRVDAVKGDTYAAVVEKAYVELQRQLDREERIEGIRNAEFTLVGYTVPQDEQFRVFDVGDGVELTILRHTRDRLAFHPAGRKYNDFWAPKVEVIIDRDMRKYDSEEDYYSLTPKTVSGLKMSWSGTSGNDNENIAYVYAQMLIKAAQTMSALRTEFNLPEPEVANG